MSGKLDETKNEADVDPTKTGNTQEVDLPTYEELNKQVEEEARKKTEENRRLESAIYTMPDDKTEQGNPDSPSKNKRKVTSSEPLEIEVIKDPTQDSNHPRRSSLKNPTEQNGKVLNPRKQKPDPIDPATLKQLKNLTTDSFNGFRRSSNNENLQNQSTQPPSLESPEEQLKERLVKAASKPPSEQVDAVIAWAKANKTYTKPQKNAVNAVEGEIVVTAADIAFHYIAEIYGYPTLTCIIKAVKNDRKDVPYNDDRNTLLEEMNDALKSVKMENLEIPDLEPKIQSAEELKKKIADFKSALTKLRQVFPKGEIAITIDETLTRFQKDIHGLKFTNKQRALMQNDEATMKLVRDKWLKLHNEPGLRKRIDELKALKHFKAFEEAKAKIDIDKFEYPISIEKIKDVKSETCERYVSAVVEVEEKLKICLAIEHLTFLRPSIHQLAKQFRESALDNFERITGYKLIRSYYSDFYNKNMGEPILPEEIMESECRKKNTEGTRKILAAQKSFVPCVLKITYLEKIKAEQEKEESALKEIHERLKKHVGKKESDKVKIVIDWVKECKRKYEKAAKRSKKELDESTAGDTTKLQAKFENAKIIALRIIDEIYGYNVLELPENLFKETPENSNSLMSANPEILADLIKKNEEKSRKVEEYKQALNKLQAINIVDTEGKEIENNANINEKIGNRRELFKDHTDSVEKRRSKILEIIFEKKITGGDDLKLYDTYYTDEGMYKCTTSIPECRKKETRETVKYLDNAYNEPGLRKRVAALKQLKALRAAQAQIEIEKGKRPEKIEEIDRNTSDIKKYFETVIKVETQLQICLDNKDNFTFVEPADQQCAQQSAIEQFAKDIRTSYLEDFKKISGYSLVEEEINFICKSKYIDDVFRLDDNPDKTIDEIMQHKEKMLSSINQYLGLLDQYLRKFPVSPAHHVSITEDPFKEVKEQIKQAKEDLSTQRENLEKRLKQIEIFQKIREKIVYPQSPEKSKEKKLDELYSKIADLNQCSLRRSFAPSMDAPISDFLRQANETLEDCSELEKKKEEIKPLIEKHVTDADLSTALLNLLEQQGYAKIEHVKEIDNIRIRINEKMEEWKNQQCERSDEITSGEVLGERLRDLTDFVLNMKDLSDNMQGLISKLKEANADNIEQKALLEGQENLIKNQENVVNSYISEVIANISKLIESQKVKDELSSFNDTTKEFKGFGPALKKEIKDMTIDEAKEACAAKIKDIKNFYETESKAQFVQENLDNAAHDILISEISNQSVDDKYKQFLKNLQGYIKVLNSIESEIKKPDRINFPSSEQIELTDIELTDQTEILTANNLTKRKEELPEAIIKTLQTVVFRNEVEINAEISHELLEDYKKRLEEVSKEIPKEYIGAISEKVESIKKLQIEKRRTEILDCTPVSDNEPQNFLYGGKAKTVEDVLKEENIIRAGKKYLPKLEYEKVIERFNGLKRYNVLVEVWENPTVGTSIFSSDLLKSAKAYMNARAECEKDLTALNDSLTKKPKDKKKVFRLKEKYETSRKKFSDSGKKVQEKIEKDSVLNQDINNDLKEQIVKTYNPDNEIEDNGLRVGMTADILQAYSQFMNELKQEAQLGDSEIYDVLEAGIEVANGKAKYHIFLENIRRQVELLDFITVLTSNNEDNSTFPVTNLDVVKQKNSLPLAILKVFKQFFHSYIDLNSIFDTGKIETDTVSLKNILQNISEYESSLEMLLEDLAEIGIPREKLVEISTEIKSIEEGIPALESRLEALEKRDKIELAFANPNKFSLPPESDLIQAVKAYARVHARVNTIQKELVAINNTEKTIENNWKKLKTIYEYRKVYSEMEVVKMSLEQKIKNDSISDNNKDLVEHINDHLKKGQPNKELDTDVNQIFTNALALCTTEDEIKDSPEIDLDSLKSLLEDLRDIVFEYKKIPKYINVNDIGQEISKHIDALKGKFFNEQTITSKILKLYLNQYLDHLSEITKNIGDIAIPQQRIILENISQGLMQSGLDLVTLDEKMLAWVPQQQMVDDSDTDDLTALETLLEVGPGSIRSKHPLYDTMVAIRKDLKSFSKMAQDLKTTKETGNNQGNDFEGVAENSAPQDNSDEITDGKLRELKSTIENLKKTVKKYPYSNEQVEKEIADLEGKYRELRKFTQQKINLEAYFQKLKKSLGGITLLYPTLSQVYSKMYIRPDQKKIARIIELLDNDRLLEKIPAYKEELKNLSEIAVSFGFEEIAKEINGQLTTVKMIEQNINHEEINTYKKEFKELSKRAPNVIIKVTDTIDLVEGIHGMALSKKIINDKFNWFPQASNEKEKMIWYTRNFEETSEIKDPATGDDQKNEPKTETIRCTKNSMKIYTRKPETIEKSVQALMDVILDPIPRVLENYLQDDISNPEEFKQILKELKFTTTGVLFSIRADKDAETIIDKILKDKIEALSVDPKTEAFLDQMQKDKMLIAFRPKVSGNHYSMFNGTRTEKVEEITTEENTIQTTQNSFFQS